MTFPVHGPPSPAPGRGSPSVPWWWVITFTILCLGIIAAHFVAA